MDAPKRTRRPKSFKGCWTCRSRHLKCDEKRPVCLRCTKSRVRCEGYGLRLTWNPINCAHHSGYKESVSTSQVEPLISTGTTSSAQHSSFSDLSTLNGNTVQAISQPSIDSAMEDSNKAFEETTGTLFLQDQLTSNDESPNSPPGDSADDAITLFGETDEALMAPFAPSQALGVRDNSLVASYSEVQDTEMGSLRTTTDDDYPTYQGLAEQRRMEGGEESSNIHQSKVLCKPRHLDLLPDLQMQSKVLQNWTFHLCDALIPVHGSNNPFRNIFTPIAMEGAGQEMDRSTASVAVFHFISSASAWHLALSSNDDEAYTRLARLALTHHNKGIMHLRRNISLEDTSQYVPLIAALTMCVICEGITLATSLWPVHIQGACQWLQGIDPNFWSQSETASIAYQCFTGLVILIQCQTISSDATTIQTPLIDFQLPAKLYCLDWIYGIPRKSLDNVISVNKILLSNNGRSAATKSTTSLSTAATATCGNRNNELHLLEIEICLSIPQVTHTFDGKTCDLMKYHASMLFYYATVIYFKRSVLGTPVDDVQILIESGIQHAEAMSESAQRPFSPIVWPVAVMAFDISDPTLQTRMINWLDSQTKRTKLDSWACIKNLASNLWRKRTARDATNAEHDIDKELSWQAFLKRSPELQIVLI